MFKLKIIFIFLAVLTSVQSIAYSKDNPDEIKKMLLQQESDWNRGDLKAYMSHYWKSDSLIFIGKSGPKYGWEETFKNYQKAYPDSSLMGKLKFDFIKIEMIGVNNAVVIGSWNLKREKDNPSGYFTLIVRKINGQWKVVTDHSS
jgi:ketosteroid isomerase-like protein